MSDPQLTWPCCAATSRCCTSPAARCSCPPGSTATCSAARCGGPGAGARTSSWPRSVRSPRTPSPTWPPAPSAATDYLRFVQQPMDFASYRAWRQSTDRPTFSAIGRWARVGVASRLLDAGFDISLSLRGVVPGGTVAVAERQYSAMQAERPGYTYYGRVVREGGYIACQYLFFYVMNDFRSTFFGVNDHEADWEQVIVYLTEPAPGSAAEPTLSWVACAAHDLHGADLRRRFDDPQLCLVDGTHPVVNVGAGSHASYFSPGEYVFSVRPKPVRRALRMVDTARQVWRESLHQGMADPAADEWSEAFAVPFIDYARGDGPQVGPGTAERLGPGADHRGRAVAGPLPRAVGPGHR